MRPGDPNAYLVATVETAHRRPAPNLCGGAKRYIIVADGGVGSLFDIEVGASRGGPRIDGQDASSLVTVQVLSRVPRLGVMGTIHLRVRDLSEGLVPFASSRS